jgi:hypothetical protein
MMDMWDASGQCGKEGWREMKRIKVEVRLPE